MDVRIELSRRKNFGENPGFCWFWVRLGQNPADEAPGRPAGHPTHGTAQFDTNFAGGWPVGTSSGGFTDETRVSKLGYF